MDTTQPKGTLGALNNNIISAKNFTVPLSDYVSSEAICKEVRVHYDTNNEGKIIKDKITAVSYSVVDPNSYTSYVIKVVGDGQPVVSPEELLEALETSTFVILDVPTTKSVIVPYRIEYGKVFVSIHAPFVTRQNYL